MCTCLCETTDNDGRPRGSIGAVDKTVDRAARAVVALLVQGDRRGGQRDVLHVRPGQVVPRSTSAAVEQFLGVFEGGSRRAQGAGLLPVVPRRYPSWGSVDTTLS